MTMCCLCGAAIAAGQAWRCEPDALRTIDAWLRAHRGLLPTSLSAAANAATARWGAAGLAEALAGFDRSWLLCPACGAGFTQQLAAGAGGGPPMSPHQRSACAIPSSDDEQGVRYRLVGEPSLGVEVTARGMRNLVTSGALAGQEWEMQLEHGGPWVRVATGTSYLSVPAATVAPHGDVAPPASHGQRQVDRVASPSEALRIPIGAEGAGLPRGHVFVEQSLRDLMAEQLRRSPWFCLSAALHAAALMLLWLLYPVQFRPAIEARIDFSSGTEQLVAVPLRCDAPEVQLEQPVDDVVTENDIDPVLTIEQDPVPEVELSGPFDANFAWATELDSARAARDPDVDRRYGGRRSSAAKQKGTGGETSAINAGLKWLAAHQDDDGRWDCDGFMKHDPVGVSADGAGAAEYDIGVTALALLAFLGNGNTAREGPYRETIKKGIAWLRRQQQDDGMFGTGASSHYIYDHAIATYAMCEAYGLSKYTLLRPVAQKALDYLEYHRNPGGVWRYGPRDGDSDLSVTGWCIMACESGRFFGLDVSDAALESSQRWLDRTESEDGNYGYGEQPRSVAKVSDEHERRFPYSERYPMAAVGLLCRFFMGESPKKRPGMAITAGLILSKPPVWDEAGGTIDSYYWYYATYALYQMGGSHWNEWREHLRAAVVRTQHHDASRPELLGSWDPSVDCWGGVGGRIYTTAMLTMTLEAYYRYSRLIR